MNPDESTLVTLARKATIDFAPWRGFDSGTSGPLNSYILVQGWFFSPPGACDHIFNESRQVPAPLLSSCKSTLSAGAYQVDNRFAPGFRARFGKIELELQGFAESSKDR
jgi:hypothetical protein